VAEAPERFDPRVRTLSVGWVPAGLTNETAEITPDYQMYAGFDETYGRSDDGSTRDHGLVVTVLAKGARSATCPTACSACRRRPRPPARWPSRER
jgi:hypothetical protein